MAKKESTFISMVLTLFIVSAVAAAALGFVYQATKEDIKKAEENKFNFALKQVLPEYNNSPKAEKMSFDSDIKGDSIHFYIARKDSIIVGYAIESFSKSAFSGLLRLIAGFTPDGKIYKVAVLEHKETPGLGTKMTEPAFANQYPGKDPSSFNLKVKKDGGKIDAITASTITSRAYSEAIQRAYDKLIQEQLLEGGKK